MLARDKMTTGRAARALTRKKTKTLPEVFAKQWRLGMEEVLEGKAPVPTAKEIGQIKMIVAKVEEMAPELTDEKLEQTVQQFARYLTMNWSVAAEVIRTATTHAPPTMPSLGWCLKHVAVLYRSFSQMKTVAPKELDEMPETPKRKTLRINFGPKTKTSAAPVEKKLTYEEMLKIEQEMEAPDE